MTQYLPATGSSAQQRQALLAKATAGDADAQSRMGDVCRTGDEFTKQDYAEVLHWYQLAAEQREAAAQNNLGAMHCNGLGVETDFAEAARWYRAAAEQSVAAAQYNLAMRYLHGQGVERDEREAAQWFRKAAEQGYVEAVGQYGTMLLRAQGMERNVPLAAKLLVAAAFAGDEVSVRELRAHRSELEAEAKRGSVVAALCLARMYERGIGVERSNATMFAWLMWGGYTGIPEEDPDAHCELFAMRERYAALPEEVKDDAWRRFGTIWSPDAIVIDNRPRYRKPPDHEQAVNAGRG